MGTLTGYLGQTAYNMLDEKHTAELTATTTITKEPLWRRALNSKYSPMKVLSDEQYAAMLKEKLLRVEADIAVIDDDIAKWKQQQDEASNTDQEQGRPMQK
jgi:hypothetical protein